MHKKRFHGIFVILIVLIASAGILTARTGAKITTESGIEMVLMEGGSFIYGPQGQQVKVELSPFYIGKYPVTQDTFQAVMGTNPSRWQTPRQPVERVTWTGAARYCNRLSRLEGLRPVYNEETWEINLDADGYRLPTEAEWEFAARAGTSTKYFWGNEPGRLPHAAWVKGNSGGQTRPVGRKAPNPAGLHDMYGNVWEWCNDFYKDGYLPPAGSKNPAGPTEGKEKVARGGSWNSPDEEATSFFRHKAEPGYSDICVAEYDVYGFRVVRNAR